LIAGRIAERGVRPLAYEQVDPNGFACSVVDEEYLWLAHQYRFAVVVLVLGQTTRSHDLLRRNAVDTLTVNAHELLTATSDYVGLEAVGAQVIHDLKHWLIDKFRMESLESGILGRRQPLLHNLPEYFGSHSSVSGGEDNFPIRFGKPGHRLTVVREYSLERLLFFPFGMPVSNFAHPVQSKQGLSIQRMFDPDRSILIESGNAILGLDILAAGLVCHFFDEGNDRLFRRPVVPRRKRGGLSVGVGADRQQRCTKHYGGESAQQ